MSDRVLTKRCSRLPLAAPRSLASWVLTCFDAGDVEQFGGDFVDGAGAEDDLELSGGEEVAFGKRDGVDGGLVNFVFVFEHHAQAGGAVRRGGDVLFATDGRDDGFSGLAVFIHGGYLLVMGDGGGRRRWRRVWRVRPAAGRRICGRCCRRR